MITRRAFLSTTAIGLLTSHPALGFGRLGGGGGSSNVTSGNGPPPSGPLPSANWPGIYSGTSPWGDTIGPAIAVPLSSTMKLSDGFFGINFAQGGFSGNGFLSHGPALSAGLVISAAQGGIYTFTILAQLINTPLGDPFEGLVRLSIDQVPIDAADGSGNFTLQTSSQTPGNLVFKGALTPGQHLLTVWLNAKSSMTFVSHIDIAFVSALPSEPPGSRDGTLQAMSSYHMFNTAIGSGAVWSAIGDADTQALISGTYGVINSAQYSSSIYTGHTSDPVQIWRNGDTTFEPCADSSVHMPAGMVPGPPQVNVGGDSVMCLFDATQPRWFWSGFSIVVNGSPTVPGVAAGRCQISDQLNGFNNAWGQGSGYTTPGIIRSWEVLAGVIKHMLILAMPNQLMKPVTTPWTTLKWPAWESDYNGAFGQYTGTAFQYGSTVGIPSTVDITSLGLTAGGLILAKCLQDYGATQQVTGGSPNPQVTLYHEVNTSPDSTLFAQMQADWNNKIIPSLRIMRNQGPNSINGGGTRRQALQPGLAVGATNLSATPFSPTQINLEWSAYAGTGVTYDIYRDGTYVMSSIDLFYYDGGLDRTSSHTYLVKVVVSGSVVAIYGPASATSLEPAPQNLALYSEDLTQGSWTKQQATITSAAFTPSYSVPGGPPTLDGLVESTELGIHQAFQGVNIGLGAIFTYTIYAKAAGRSWITLNIQDTIPHRVLFDLVNGVVGAFPDSAGAPPTITPVGDGVYRCSMSVIPTTTSIYTAVTTSLSDNTSTDETTPITYVGNGALALYIGGAQFQQNFPATSYVKTLGFPVSLTGGDKAAPTVPVSVYSISTSATSNSITWNPSSDDTQMGSYEIFRSLGSGNPFQVGTISVGNGAPSTYPIVGFNQMIGSGLGNWFYDTGLPASTLCKYYIRAVDNSGNRSGFSILNSCSTISLVAPDPKLKYLRPATLSDPNPTALTLRAKAAARGLYIGSMVDPTGDSFGTTNYNNILKSEFNLMVPGNQLKWGYTEPAQGTYSFTPVDPLLTFASANNLKVRGHNLLWGAGNPGWLQNLTTYPYTTFTGAELSTLLTNHINAVVGHCVTNYPGIVITWDVTNEIIGWNGSVDTTFSGDQMIWVQANTSPDGLDYVRLAFNTAHAADPNAILCMNDYGNGGTTDFTGNHGPTRTRNLLNLIRYLLIQGTPIHAMGLQSHHEPPTYDEVMAVMKECRDMGLSCHVTECDFGTPSSVVLPAIDNAAYVAAATYESNLLQAALDSPNCTMFTLWGFNGPDNALHGQGGPGNLFCYPWNTLGNKSQIYTALYNKLAGITAPPNPKILLSNGTSHLLRLDGVSKIEMVGP